MWFENQVILPRILKSFLCTILVQESYLCILFFILRVLSWNPFLGMIDWLFHLVHWRTLLYQTILCLSTIAFGVLNKRFYAVEKHICSTRFEKMCRAFSPQQVQHFLLSSFLGGLVSYCCIGLFHSFDPEKKSILGSFLVLENDFEHFFAVQHGCYVGIMFSLKYFICCLYIVKLTLNQETKVQNIKGQIKELLKDSIFCVLKSMHWYYLIFILLGPSMENTILSFGFKLSPSESIFNLMYSLINLKLFLVSFLSGVIIFFNWSFYLTVFNVLISERHVFPIEIPVKTDKDKSLAVALASSESDIVKYLAVLDLRLLSQHDVQRRKQIFTISHPGGHPHQWNALSNYCILSLKTFVNKLQEYSLATAAKESKIGFAKAHNCTIDEFKKVPSEPCLEKPNFSGSICIYVRGWPAIAYFIHELPTAKIQQIFATSQPLIWMIEALGFLVSASYTEDKFGVIQQVLPEIICLLLDIKMAEEKLPLDLVGIRVQVKDPQGRHEHIHQRVTLKTSVNASLLRIADTFKNDINGIYLPEEYHRYFQRYLNRKNM